MHTQTSQRCKHKLWFLAVCQIVPLEMLCIYVLQNVTERKFPTEKDKVFGGVAVGCCVGWVYIFEDFAWMRFM